MSQSSPVRATTLLGYSDLVDSLGGNPLQLLKNAGIDPSLSGKDDQFIRYQSFVDLLEQTAKVLNEPTFGLKLSSVIPLESLGAVAAVARSAENALIAISEVAQYIHHYSPVVYLSLVRSDGIITLVQDLHLNNTIPRQQITDLKLGMTYNFPRYLTESPIQPVSVSCRHTNDKYAKEYTTFFGCPVKFGQTDNAVSFRQDDLLTPIKNADSFLHELAEHHIGMETLGLNTDRVKQVRLIIARLLPTSECTLHNVAAKLLVHERSLQRQLKAQGSSFQQLIDEVRKEKAMAYLNIPNMPMSKVAEMLGFEEQSSFNKAFQRWYQERPSEFRKRLTEANQQD